MKKGWRRNAASSGVSLTVRQRSRSELVSAYIPCVALRPGIPADIRGEPRRTQIRPFADRRASQNEMEIAAAGIAENARVDGENDGVAAFRQTGSIGR